jgi:hypothetical protein
MISSAADRELIKHVNGLYIGFLDSEELDSLDRCIQDKVALRDYDNPGGILGLAKVKYIGETNGK